MQSNADHHSSGVYVPADDLTDRGGACVFASLASIVLSRKRAAKDFIRPSTYSNPARKWTPGIVGDRHYNWHKKSENLAQYEALKDIVAMLAWNSFPRRP